MTATCFTVVGVLNKMVTVLANLLLSAQHASPAGILSLLVCILATTGYKQAPLRSDDLVPLKGEMDAAEVERASWSLRDEACELELEPLEVEQREDGAGASAAAVTTRTASSTSEG